MRAAWPAIALASAAVRTDPSSHADDERGVGTFDCDQAVGQTVSDGLEGADRPTELDTIAGVIARQFEHRSRRPDQLMRECEPTGGNRVLPGSRPAHEGSFRAHPSGHLHQAHLRIETLDRRHHQVAAVDGQRDVPCTRRGHDHRPTSAADIGRARAPDHHRLSLQTTGRLARTERGQHRDHRFGGDPERIRDHDVECGAGRVGTAQHLEEDRDRRAPVGRQRITPSELLEGVVECLPRARRGGVSKALSEDMELALVDHASAPRSRRRRATMLRWISMVPP